MPTYICAVLLTYLERHPGMFSEAKEELGKKVRLAYTGDPVPAYVLITMPTVLCIRGITLSGAIATLEAEFIKDVENDANLEPI